MEPASLPGTRPAGCTPHKQTCSELLGTARRCSEVLGAARSYSGMLRGAWGCLELLGAALSKSRAGSVRCTWYSPSYWSVYTIG